MKILFITPCYYPAIAFGGTVSAMTQICSALNSKGAEVEVYTTNSNGALGYLDVPVSKLVEVRGVGVTYFRCSIGNKKAFYSSTMMEALNQHVKKYDLVYISAVWQYIGVKAANICKKKKIPYIFGTHGSFSKKLMKKKVSLKKTYFDFFLTPVLKNAAALHVTANQEVEDAKEDWMNNETLITIPNIIDPTLYKKVTGTTFKKRYNIPEKAKVIITVSRPDWMKRVDLLIKVVSEFSDYYLIFAGEKNDPMVDSWNNLATSSGMSNRFICTGLLKRDELLEAYSAADLFCLISENENFGMVVAEALLCETPVVISKQAAITEYLENSTVVKVVDIDEAEIRTAILAILKNPNLDRSVCRQLAINHFSPDNVGQIFINEFEGLLARNEK